MMKHKDRIGTTGPYRVGQAGFSSNQTSSARRRAPIVDARAQKSVTIRIQLITPSRS